MSIRCFQVKLNPTADQSVQLRLWLDRCRNLYNGLLEQRILAYRQSKSWPSDKAKETARSLSSRYGQQIQLPDLKAECSEFSIVSSNVLQDVCTRIDKTFKVFFQRNKTIKTGGFPRFKGFTRYNSFTHPQIDDAHIDRFNCEFRLPSFGWIKCRLGDLEIPTGRFKTATVRLKPDGWWLSLSYEPIESTSKLRNPNGLSVGLDLGLKNLVTTSDGEVLGDLGPIKKAEQKIRLTQRALSRKKAGSNRRRKCKAVLARQSLRLTRTKDLQLQTISRQLVARFDTIVVEDLNIKGLLDKDRPVVGLPVKAAKGLRRNIGLAGWNRLVSLLSYKAEDAGGRLVKIDPKGTSQQCSSCGAHPKVKKTLKDRIHRCEGCGFTCGRDHNAAMNVLSRGLNPNNKTGGIAPSWIPSTDGPNWIVGSRVGSEKSDLKTVDNLRVVA